MQRTPPSAPAAWRVEVERAGPGPPGRRRIRDIEVVLAVALVVAVGLVAVYRLDPAALGVEPGSSGAATPPNYQPLTQAGETWLISDSAPHIVNFTSPVSGAVWMNFTVTGGAVAVDDCPANIVIEPMGYPPCSGTGVFDRAHGSYIQWADSVVYAAKLVFINYGPSSGSAATVTLTWSSALVVDGY